MTKATDRLTCAWPDLLEQVYREPPRDQPFSLPFQPHFNWLKYFALLGIHVMFALKLHPKRFARIAPRFADFAGRIYGYVEKAAISPAEAAAMEEKIKRFLPKKHIDTQN